MYQFRL